MNETSDGPAELRPGQFFGAVGGRRQCGLVTVSVIDHPQPRQVPEHSHEHMFFSVLLQGGYREWADGRCLEYTPMTAVFHPERLLHRDEITAPASRFLVVEVDPTLLDARERGHSRLRSVHDLGGGPLAWSLLRMLPLLERDGLDGLRFEEPIAEILDAMLGVLEPAANPPGWLPGVESLLRARCRTSVSLRDLSEVAGVHANHVARVFRRHHGVSVRRWLHRQRILHACRLLAAGLPLAQAALDSGFFDQSHLTRVFRATTGMTPGGYRRAVGSRE
jgi:AraC family transcriptional regulator